MYATNIENLLESSASNDTIPGKKLTHQNGNVPYKDYLKVWLIRWFNVRQHDNGYTDSFEADLLNQVAKDGQLEYFAHVISGALAHNIHGRYNLSRHFFR